MATIPPAAHDYHLVIQRLPEESVDEWRRMLDDLEANGRATVTRLPDDCAGLRWEAREAAA